MKVPLIVTSYNMHEAFEDEDTFVEWGVPYHAWCWRPELNPFRSLEKRRGNATCNNCYWQCIWDDRAEPESDSAKATSSDSAVVEHTSTGTTTLAVNTAQRLEIEQKQRERQKLFPLNNALATLQRRANELNAKVLAKAKEAQNATPS